jgi:hypothetical protein
MAELSETYIHLRPFDPSEAVLRDLGRAADAIAYGVARDIYGTGVEVEVTLEKGSLKSWITVSASSIFLIYVVLPIIRGLRKVFLKCAKMPEDLDSTSVKNFRAPLELPNNKSIELRSV